LPEPDHSKYFYNYHTNSYAAKPDQTALEPPEYSQLFDQLKFSALSLTDTPVSEKESLANKKLRRKSLLPMDLLSIEAIARHVRLKEPSEKNSSSDSDDADASENGNNVSDDDENDNNSSSFVS